MSSSRQQEHKTLVDNFRFRSSNLLPNTNTNVAKYFAQHSQLKQWENSPIL
jgi:hypothetical protein